MKIKEKAGARKKGNNAIKEKVMVIIKKGKKKTK